MELCQLNRKYFEVYRLKKKKKENVTVPEFGRRLYIYQGSVYTFRKRKANTNKIKMGGYAS